MKKFSEKFTKVSILALIILGFTLITWKINAANSNFNQVIYPITQCNDGIDNDGDGGIDFASDPDCTSWLDDNEGTSPITPTPTVATTIIPTQLQKPTNLNSENIMQQITNTTIPNLVQKYLWEPLGKVLGYSTDVDENGQFKDTRMGNSVLFLISGIFIVSYYLLLLILIIIYRIRKKQNLNE